MRLHNIIETVRNILVNLHQQQQQQQFKTQCVLVAPPHPLIKNWRILLEQRFTALITLLTAISALLGR